MFRELAISYLGRNDLAHVDPSEIGGTVIGKGEDQGRIPDASTPYVSSGFVRGKHDKLMLVQATGTHGAPLPDVTSYVQTGSVLTTALLDDGAAVVEALNWHSAGSIATPARDVAADRRAEARMKGYVGEACPECQNFTLVRNGTCLKCDTCGSTTGCS